MDESQIDLGLEYLLHEFAVWCMLAHYSEIHRSQALALLHSKSSSRKLFSFKMPHATFIMYNFSV